LNKRGVVQGSWPRVTPAPEVRKHLGHRLGSSTDTIVHELWSSEPPPQPTATGTSEDTPSKHPNLD